MFLGLQHGIAEMLENGGGSVINTSSIASAVGIPGQSGYAATKAGINTLTRVAAVEYVA